MKKRIKYIFALVLLIFLPLSWDILQPGPHYFGIWIITLFGIIWLVNRSRKNMNFRIPKFFLPLVMFFGLQVGLLIIAPDRSSGYHWIIFELYLFSFLIIVLDKLRNSEQRKFWENLLIGAGLVYAFIDLAYVLLWYVSWWRLNGSLLPLPPTALRSPGMLLGFTYLQSSYLNIVIIIVLVRLINAKTRSGRILWLEILAILILANFFTYSRAGWLALAGGITVALLINYSFAWKTRADLWVKFQQTKFGRYIKILLVPLLVAVTGFAVLFALKLQSAPHGTWRARSDIYSYVIRWVSYSPIWGHGTGATPYIFSHRYYAIAGDEVYQAHNLWLQIALESGLLGLVLFMMAIGFIIRANISSWQKWKENPGNRARMSGYIGIGVAVLIQSTLDNMFWKAAYAVALIIIIALIYSLAPKKEYYSIQKMYILPVIGILLISSTAGLIYIRRGMSAYSEGKTATKEWDWENSRINICKAADINPGNAFYSFQCSLAIAHQAEITNNINLLSDASTYLRKGLKINPQWYVHWANLASYEWKLGNQETAVEFMKEAINLAPNRSYLWLNLARMQEQTGNTQEAKDAYLVSVCQDPFLQESIAFVNSELFQEAARDDCPPGSEILPYHEKLIWEGWQAFLSGDFGDAEIIFQQAAKLDPRSGEPLAYLALIHNQEGRLLLSDRELRTSLFLNDQSAEIQQIAAKIVFSRGEDEKGIDYLTEAFIMQEQNTLSDKYYDFSYFDRGLLTDKSPFLPAVFLNYEQRDAFFELSQYLKENGYLEMSSRVERWLESNMISPD